MVIIDKRGLLVKREICEVFDGKTVLVTGGAGAIGSNLVRTLNSLDTERIVILDDLSSSYEWNIPKGPKIAFIKGSVLDADSLNRVFKENLR